MENIENNIPDISSDKPDPETELNESRVLPHSREAEEAVIGSVLINPDKFTEVSQYINKKDFYIRRNQFIWEAIEKLAQSNHDIDLGTVAENLNDMGKLEDIGGKAFLFSVASNTPSSMHAETYAQIVAEKSVRRQMIEAAGRMNDLAFDQKKDLKTVISESEKEIFNISQNQDKKDIVNMRQLVGEVYTKIEMLGQQDSDIVGVPTGLRDLDKLLGGMQKSDLIIIAARPGMGKTGFLLTVLKNLAINSKRNIAMFSLEMSSEQLVHRLIAQQTGISTQKLRTGKLSADEYPLLVDAIDILGDTNIFLDDTPGITPLQLRTKCRRLHMEHHLDLIIIDYIQLMSGDYGKDNRVQEVSYISRQLKILARELNVPVLTAAQLSRSVEQRENKKPMLSDLRESGSLEQDADVVIFIHNPEQDETNGGTAADNGARKLIVAKHRNGPIDELDVVFRKNIARFEDAAHVSDYAGH